MNIDVTRNAIGSLDKLLSDAKEALSQLESEEFGLDRPSKGGAFEYPRGALKHYLQQLYDILVVVLEAAELPDARASLIKEWSRFEKKGLGYTDDSEEFQSCESPALTFLDRIIQGLRMTVTGEMSSEEAWTLHRLEAMLRDTAGLVHRRNPPRNEPDLQRIMHDYLSAAFPDFDPQPDIGGTLKHFKPDCGIRSVGAAIEFKIVHTREQVATAFSGITEDTSGYKGSKDWTRFYAVVYQARPFMLESHLRGDMKRIGAATWTPIVVNGPTKKRALKRKSRKRPPATQSGKRGRAKHGRKKTGRPIP